MVTASVLLIHYSSPWTGQAARGSTITTYTVSLIPLFTPLFISLTPSTEIREKSSVHLLNSLLSLFPFLVPGNDKTPCPLLILLFITVFNEKLLHTLHTTHSECISQMRKKMYLGGAGGRVSSRIWQAIRYARKQPPHKQANIQTPQRKLGHVYRLSPAIMCVVRLIQITQRQWRH